MRITAFVLLFSLVASSVHSFQIQPKAIHPFHFAFRSRGSRRSSSSKSNAIHVDDSTSSGISSSTTEPTDRHEIAGDMPWGEFQEWALRDNLRRYTVTILSQSSSEKGKEALPRQFALWRAMIRDVPELYGYDTEFVRNMHSQTIKKNDETSTPGILPLLDQFSFEPDGSMSGVVYDLPGMANGCPMRTAPLQNIEKTIPLGYVSTQEGNVAYELGTARTEEENNSGLYSLDGLTRWGKASSSSSLLDATKASGTKIVDLAQKESDADVEMLAKLGSLTAMVLALGAGLNMLSHHLTVNVFWV